nr:MAG TPA: hypothetical protein [Caudoviricetes sp.]
MAKRKRSNLDEAIGKALHGTRNKVYRLKKKGASASEIAAIDPRKTDWRSSRGGAPGSATLYERYRKGELNTREKGELLRQLKDFNERENSYASTGGGRFISSKARERFGAMVEGVNKTRKRTLDNIIKGGAYYQFGAPGVDVASMSEWDFKHYVARNLSPIKRTEPFTSSKQIARAMQTVLGATSSMRGALKKSESWRRAARNMLIDNNQRELAEAIGRMSAEEFLEMATLTDFNVRMTDFPYQDYFTVQGHSRERGLAAAQDESSRYMIGLVDRFSQSNAAKDKK